MFSLDSFTLSQPMPSTMQLVSGLMAITQMAPQNGTEYQLKNTQYWGKTQTKTEFVFSLDLNPNISSFSWCPKQFATSFKMFLDNWNIQTSHWLKRWIIWPSMCVLPEISETMWALLLFSAECVMSAARTIRLRPHSSSQPSGTEFTQGITWPSSQASFVTMAARAVSILYIRWAVKTRFNYITKHLKKCYLL